MAKNVMMSFHKFLKLFYHRFFFFFSLVLIFSFFIFIFFNLYRSWIRLDDKVETLRAYWIASRAIRLNPLQLGLQTKEEYLQELLFLPLVSFDADAQIRFMLAESIQSDPEFRIWTVRLRPVFTSTGREVYAGDVKAFFERFIIHNKSQRSYLMRSNVERIEVIDERVLTFHLRHPDPDWPYQLTIGVSLGDREFTGPLMVEKQETHEVIFRLNPVFNFKVFGFQKPSWQTLQLFLFEEKLSLKMQVMAQTPHLIFPMSWSEVEQRALGRVCPQYRMFRQPGLNTFLLSFNLKHPDTPSLSFRRSLQCLIFENPSYLSFMQRERPGLQHAYFFFPFWYLQRQGEQVQDWLQDLKQFCRQQNIDLTWTKPIVIKNAVHTPYLHEMKMLFEKMKIPLQIKVFEYINSLSLLEQSIGTFLWFKGLKTIRFLNRILSSTEIPPQGLNYTYSMHHDPFLEHENWRGLLRSVWQESAYIFLFHDEENIVRCGGHDKWQTYADGRLWTLFHF